MAKPTTPAVKMTDSTIAHATQMVRNLYDTSAQSMYLYQDDHNKSCNKRFAQLLGYASPEEWAAVHTNFPSAFVQPESQGKLIDAYQTAMQSGVASAVPITWKRKDGKPVKTNVILAPIEVGGHRLALHFIT